MQVTVSRTCVVADALRFLRLKDHCENSKGYSYSLQRLSSATTRCVSRSQYLDEVRGRVHRRGDPIRNAVMAEAPLNIFTVPLDSVGADWSTALLKSWQKFPAE